MYTTTVVQLKKEPTSVAASRPYKIHAIRVFCFLSSKASQSPCSILSVQY